MIISLKNDSLLVNFLYHLISLSECKPRPLGMESGDIPDSGITASSYHHHVQYDREPQYARLGGDKFWLSARSDFDVNPWIQVDLGRKHMVTGLQTAGSSDDKYMWVEQIKVQVGVTEDNLMFVLSKNGQPKVRLLGCLYSFFTLQILLLVLFLG